VYFLKIFFKITIIKKIMEERRKSVRRKSVRRKSVRRKSVRRKSVRRKSVRRKSTRRKSVRRKSGTRKCPKTSNCACVGVRCMVRSKCRGYTKCPVLSRGKNMV
jgi:hypothetical protein